MFTSSSANVQGRRYFLTGGTGFIGSHLAGALLEDDCVESVTLYDNFSSGREWHYEAHESDRRLHVRRADLQDLTALTEAMAGYDVVVHLASNPDIARAVFEPQIDFEQGTRLTNNVVEAMRRSGVRRLLYASGSGVYGDLGTYEVNEDHCPLIPISTYGASKLAGEALIASYCAMFDLTACVFRFANVVGARQTHGVGLDFVRRLIINPKRLQILGDGKQSKSYIHVSDVVSALLRVEAHSKEPFAIFNVASEDAITVTEIAELAAECLQLNVLPDFEYTGGDRGWRGDVPVVRLNCNKVRGLGWACRYTSREAIRIALMEMIADGRVCYA
ncbi:NAD-dependent epimerase/dehydratase family protein [Alloacidobacterium dinghuense]|uniref:NAD-dependent epimerase/dehydratase family protein n=1 Tax=Alloacidobacterium dinghuense TaxID=2763107 RepID=A0A7G8BJH4_9BACT|nr:NAD-dependent epimerase/dehydratase family protein [Alloacidobacterium dinghuense]QNI32694.1 NAD-dependent epimerase/dehydratase family protein [Alloacidobacterium dinghuense]